MPIALARARPNRSKIAAARELKLTHDDHARGVPIIGLANPRPSVTRIIRCVCMCFRTYRSYIMAYWVWRRCAHAEIPFSAGFARLCVTRDTMRTTFSISKYCIVNFSTKRKIAQDIALTEIYHRSKHKF